MSKVGGADWERICFFGPYSHNAIAEKSLGFQWDIEEKTSIASSETVNVLVFVKGQTVVIFTEHPRNLGDFAELSDQCFDRTEAVFVRNKERKDNWISFVKTDK